MLFCLVGLEKARVYIKTLKNAKRCEFVETEDRNINGIKHTTISCFYFLWKNILTVSQLRMLFFLSGSTL